MLGSSTGSEGIVPLRSWRSGGRGGGGVGVAWRREVVGGWRREGE